MLARWSDLLSIFICEDNTIHRRTIEGYIQNYLLIEELDMTIEVSTDDPYEIISYLEKNSVHNGIYFLDIDLQCELDGIKLGAKIRNMDISGKIVFITTHSEMMYFTFKYKVEAMDYIIKDNINDLQKRIIAALEQAKKHYQEDKNDQKERIKIIINKQIRVFPLKEVMFIETSQVPHKLILHLSQNTIEFYGKIHEIESLASSLIRIHKSVVVNIGNIATIDRRKYMAVMKNGESCPIAIRKISMLKRRLR